MSTLKSGARDGREIQRSIPDGDLDLGGRGATFESGRQPPHQLPRRGREIVVLDSDDSEDSDGAECTDSKSLPIRSSRPRTSRTLQTPEHPTIRHHEPSEFSRYNNVYNTDSPVPRSGRKVSEVFASKASNSVKTSQPKPATTATTTTTTTTTTIADASPVTNPSNARPLRSSFVLPPTFAPAVKTRIYSSPPSRRQKPKPKPKGLASFGFGPVDDTAKTTWGVTNVGSMPVHAPMPNREPVSQAIKQEPVQLSTPSSNLMIKPKAIRGELERASPPTGGTLQIIPRTPEKQVTARPAIIPSSVTTTGTYGDPYDISSDSNNESDDGYHGSSNRGERHNAFPSTSYAGIPSMRPVTKEERQHDDLPSFKSFAEVPVTQYETANDVEAVLGLFPSWLDTPRSTELRLSYCQSSPITTTTTTSAAALISSTAVTPTRPGKTLLWRNGDGMKTVAMKGCHQNRSRVGLLSRENDALSDAPSSFTATTAKQDTFVPNKSSPIILSSSSSSSSSSSRNSKLPSPPITRLDFAAGVGLDRDKQGANPRPSTSMNSSRHHYHHPLVRHKTGMQPEKKTYAEASKAISRHRNWDRRAWRRRVRKRATIGRINKK